MSGDDGKPSLADRKAKFEAAQAAQRAHLKGMWLAASTEDDSLAEHFFRRSFAMEILNADSNLKPHVAEFLGRCAVDRNTFSQKQKDWLKRLIEEHVGIGTPKTDAKSKKKTEAGK